MNLLHARSEQHQQHLMRRWSVISRHAVRRLALSLLERHDVGFVTPIERDYSAYTQVPLKRKMIFILVGMFQIFKTSCGSISEKENSELALIRNLLCCGDIQWK